MDMGTASTMACVTEALGMMLPGGACIPAVMSERMRNAEATGARAVAIAKEGLTPDKVMTPDAFENALTMLLAIGGSTNAIVHLAAMAGVRNSLRNPKLYFDVNVMGSLNLLEAAVKYKIKNFVFASSSSVYGNNKKLPFSESDPVDTPISPYAASKAADELIAHTYHHIYGLNITALRYFTVYGPWGRPDMALFLFADAITKGKPIKVFNYGKMSRNFTYVDDVATGTIAVLDKGKGYGVMNIGGDREETLSRYIEVLEKNLGKKAKKKMMPIQPGDVPKTVADIRRIRKLGWKPTTRIEAGIKKFVEWYKEYHRV